MFPVKKVLSLAPLVTRNIAKRNMSAVPIPPRVKISNGESFVLGSFIVASILATPIWVLLHIKEYRGED